MYTLRSLLSPLATAALCAAAVRSATAQRTPAPDYVRPVAYRAAATTDAPLARTVAVYRLAGSRELDMPTQVTIADSAGTLVAAFRLSHGPAYPMSVDLVDSNLRLQGATRSGVLTIVLYQPAESPAVGAVIGRWTLGEHEGELRARAASSR